MNFFKFEVSRVTFSQACTATYMCISGLNLVCSGTQCICISGFYWNGATCGKYDDIITRKTSILNAPCILYIKLFKKIMNHLVVQQSNANQLLICIVQQQEIFVNAQQVFQLDDVTVQYRNTTRMQHQDAVNRQRKI